jgi:hypothetical protein
MIQSALKDFEIKREKRKKNLFIGQIPQNSASRSFNGKMHNLKIEKGISIPERLSTSLATAFRALRPGDSVLIPIGLQAGCHKVAKNVGIGIITRKETKDMVRVWRCHRNKKG